MYALKHVFALLIIPVSVLLAEQLAPARLPKKPSVELRTSNTLLTYPCPPDGYSASRSCPLTIDLRIPLTAYARGFSKRAVYSYSVTGGRIVGGRQQSDLGPKRSRAGPLHRRGRSPRQSETRREFNNDAHNPSLFGLCHPRLPVSSNRGDVL